MSKNLTISNDLVKTMRDGGAFRTEGYRMHKNFTGKYVISNIVPTKRRGEDEETGYRVDCKSESGSHSIAGFMFSNALVVPKGSKMPEEGITEKTPSINYYESIDELVRMSERAHRLLGVNEDDDFKFPESFNVLGAVVSKDSLKDHPYIPLSRYPFYRTILKHHQITNPKETYVNRDNIDMYLAADKASDLYPKGLPKDYKFELANHSTAVKDEANWSPTLIIEDWRVE